MSPDPDQTPADVPEREYFSGTWQNLPWTPWVPFTAAKEKFRQIPKEPGLYRIRPVGKDYLMYIGETRKTLHQRLADLRVELRKRGRMPWCDPHAEAPALWAWQDAEAFEYECSASPLDATVNSRRGMECYLLYRYRQERGESTACNFGRFHPRYRKSTSGRENLRGGKLEAGQKDNPAGGPGHLPLPATGTPGDADWMGLAWSSHEARAPEKITAAPAGQGLYMLIDAGSQECRSIGQSGDCAKRLLGLSKKAWDGKEL
ncbi:MAG: hypothetical protein WC620_09215 [Methanoregula sp.]|jgi:hypothetical protein